MIEGRENKKINKNNNIFSIKIYLKNAIHKRIKINKFILCN